MTRLRGLEARRRCRHRGRWRRRVCPVTRSSPNRGDHARRGEDQRNRRGRGGPELATARLSGHRWAGRGHSRDRRSRRDHRAGPGAGANDVGERRGRSGRVRSAPPAPSARANHRASSSAHRRATVGWRWPAPCAPSEACRRPRIVTSTTAARPRRSVHRRESCITTTARRCRGTRSSAAMRSATDCLLCSNPSGSAALSGASRMGCGISRARRRRCVQTTRNATPKRYGRSGRVRSSVGQLRCNTTKTSCARILDVARVDAESLQGSEQVVELPVERLETGALRLRHERHRMDLGGDTPLIRVIVASARCVH